MNKSLAWYEAIQDNDFVKLKNSITKGNVNEEVFVDFLAELFGTFTPLSFSIKHNRADMVTFLLSQGADPGRTFTCGSLLLDGVEPMESDVVNHVQYALHLKKHRPQDFAAVLGAMEHVLSGATAAGGSGEEFEQRPFGVELELILPNTYGSQLACQQAVAAALQGLGLNAISASYSSSQYDKWQIKYDGSLEPSAGMAGVEVVTPVLKGKEGYEDLKKVLAMLKSQLKAQVCFLGHSFCCISCLSLFFCLQVNSSCGLHVHVNGKDVKYELEALRSICVNFIMCEQGFDLLISKGRRGNQNSYCQSNRSSVKGGELSAKVHYIRECCTVDELIRQMNKGDNRYFKLNLQPLRTIGSLEFRMHDGSVEFDTICNWIRLCQNFVDYSAGGSSAVVTDQTWDPLWQMEIIFQASVKNPGLKAFFLQRAKTFDQAIDFSRFK